MGCSLGGLLSLITPISESMGCSRGGVSAARRCISSAWGCSLFWARCPTFRHPIVRLLAGSCCSAWPRERQGEHSPLICGNFQLLVRHPDGKTAAGAFYAPMMAAPAPERKSRSLAVSVVSAGMGVAPLTVVSRVASLLIAA